MHYVTSQQRKGILSDHGIIIIIQCSDAITWKVCHFKTQFQFGKVYANKTSI